MVTHNFRKLDIWIKAMEIVKEVYIILGDLPVDERYGLKSQLARCAVSVPSNIAEGTGRTSTKDFGHFLDIALGSAYELETQLLLVKELFNKETEPIVEKCQHMQRMIIGFKKKLYSS